MHVPRLKDTTNSALSPDDVAFNILTSMGKRLLAFISLDTSSIENAGSSNMTKFAGMSACAQCVKKAMSVTFRYVNNDENWSKVALRVFHAVLEFFSTLDLSLVFFVFDRPLGPAATAAGGSRCNLPSFCRENFL